MEDDDEEDYHRFIISWDDIGVEAVHDIDAEISRKVEAALREETYKAQNPSELLEMIMLRARFNSHRNYEVYVARIPSSVTEDGLRSMFESNFHDMADLLRKKGQKLF